MGNIATKLILSAKEQLDEAIKQATSKIELLDNLLQQGLGEEQLKQVVEEKINDGTIGNAIFNQDNIITLEEFEKIVKDNVLEKYLIIIE